MSLSTRFVALLCLSQFCCSLLRREGAYWPCSWRGKPFYCEENAIFFTTDRKIGSWTTLSRPPGDQTSTSEMVDRRGQFFVLKEFGEYRCMFVEPLSKTDFKYYITEEGPDRPFCEICDFDTMEHEGPFYGSTYIYDVPPFPVKCQRPPGCPLKSDNDVRCPSHVPGLDSGRFCHRKQSSYLYFTTV